MGFTIVEVMIVLAVTGIMFVSAVVLINGRQNKTEFTTAINNLQQQLQQIINETVSGYYPNQGTFTCQGNSTGPVTFTGTATKQGANGGCIFMGKAIQFGSDTNPSALGVLPLAGNQFQPSTTDAVLTVAQAKPRAVYPGALDTPNVPTNLAATSFMENGLSVATSNNFCGGGLGGICYLDAFTGTKLATGIVAFISGDSSGNITSTDASGNLQPGSQQMSLYGVTGSTANKSLTVASDAVGGTGSPASASKLAAASQVAICIASATTKQSGLFLIDGGLHVSLGLHSGLIC